MLVPRQVDEPKEARHDEVGTALTCTAVCQKEFKITQEDQKKFRLEGHCFGCSADYTAVLRKSPNPEIKQWFIGLRVKDPEQYRTILADASSSKSKDASGYLRNPAFNLATYKESQKQMRGTRQSAPHELKTWPYYKDGTSCFESISQHVSNCLQKAKGAADSCEDEACVFAISDAVKHLDAAIGGQMLGHKITDIEDLKQEIIDSLSRRGKQLHEKLAHEISLEQIPDLASFFDTWGRLHTFIGKAQNASLSAPLERPVQMMKLVSANATAKMNLTAPINRLLGWTKSLENSGELTGSDLEYVSSLLNQALQRYKDGSDLSAAYRTWTTDLCTSLQEFASELKSSELPATFMYMAIVDHFKQHLEGCPWEDTFAECKNTFAASLRSKKGLQDVRKALDKQRSWLNWITGSDGSILVRSVETYLKSGLSSLRQELERSDLDLVVAFENFEPLRTEV